MRRCAKVAWFTPALSIAILFVLTCGVMPLCHAQTPPSAEEEKERITADRFLQVLLRRPNQGTALDRVFGYHISRGDIGQLLQRLEGAATADENADESGRHWMVIGLLQLQRSEDASAIKALAQAEEQLDTNPYAAYYHAQALLRVGKTDEAAAAMQRAIDLNPSRRDHLTIAGHLGRLYQRAGKTEEALKIWKQLEASFPGDDAVAQRIARIMLEEGDFQGALQRFDALAKNARSPNDKIVFALRAANLRAQLGKKDEALRAFEKLLSRLRPGSYLYDETRRRIEATFLGTGDYAGLTNYYETWVKDHPEDVGAVIRLARTLSVQGRGPEAIEWFGKAIEKSPSDPQPRIALINAHVAAEEFAEAAEQYEGLIEVDSGNPDHFVRWGQILLADKQTQLADRKRKAADVWKQLASSRSEDAVIQSQVADLLREAELSEQAIQYYQEAIKLAPDQPQYKEYLGEYLFKQDRKSDAMNVWQTLVEGDLRNRANLIRLAEVLHQFEQPEKALVYMEEACTLDPTIDERLRFANWLRDAERYDDALKQIALAEVAVESFDEGERVFAAEIKTYQASGQLDDRIELAVDEIEQDSKNANQWRRLAILYNAAGKIADATEAIEESLKFDAKSIEALAIAARMYEDAGKLDSAIEKRRLLAEIDTKFRNGHLQKLASLHLRVGETQLAVDAGKELLASSGGAIEAFRFYADLCGKIGRSDERLDTLRRCARLNPRSNEAQGMLASQLAEDFKTDQAIELYWKMLDSADDLDGRRTVVQRLAELYLRSNRLDQLISRLEIRGRESGDRRSTVDLIATVHQQAGDLGLARQALESLMQENGRDTLLLERLVSLAEQAGEFDEAVALQRQLTRLSPERKNEARLASLLIEIGAVDEAQGLWIRMSESGTDMETTSRNIDRLYAAGETDTAIKLISQGLKVDPQNWELRVKLMVLFAEDGETEKAAEQAERILAMDLPDETLPEGKKPYQQVRTTSSGQVYTRPPLRIARTQELYSFYQHVDERYRYQSTTTLPVPMDFGHAKLMALYCHLKQLNQESRAVKQLLDELETKAMAESATADDVWNWFDHLTMASVVRQNSGLSFQKPSTWKPYWRLLEVDPEAGVAFLTNMFSSRSSYAQRGDVELSKLPEDRLQWLKDRSEQDIDGANDMYGRSVSWSDFYASELRVAGQTDEADKYLEALLEKSLSDPDSVSIATALSQAEAYGNDDQYWAVIERALQDESADPRGRFSKDPSRLLLSFTSPKRVTDKRSKGAKDETYRKRVLQLFDAMLANEANQPLRRKAIRLTGIGGTRTRGAMINGTYVRTEIEFPPQGLGPDNNFVFAQYSVWEQLKDYSEEWRQSLTATMQQSDEPRLAIAGGVALASLCHWEQQTQKAAEAMKQTVALAADSIPQLEPEMRLMSADLLLRLNRKREALSAIDALTVYDQQTMAVREFAAVRLAAAIGDRERAQAAAKRLFGVRMNTQAQIELAKLMRKLEMRDLAADLVRRMRSQGGSNTDQLQSLMTYFVAQGENDQAAEVAMELLRRSAPLRRSTSRSMSSSQVRRRNALQTLASTGRLTKLIESTEEKLKNTPNSQRLRGELAEMYLAAGKPDKSQELLGGTDVKDVSSTRALQATAEQLVAAGKMDEACDAYLKYLRRRQTDFNQKFYDIKRPFDATQRLGELADLMIEVGVAKFTDHRVSEICEDLLDNESNIEKARKLYLSMLERPSNSTNSMYSMSNIMGRASKILTDKEIVLKTAQFMIDASESGTDWNTLFNGYSTSSDGRHNNVTTYFVRHVAKEPENAKAVEEKLRQTINETEDWHEGKVWLGLLLVTQESYEEALELISPLVSEDFTPAPSHDLIWLVGSLIDQHEPMQPLAEKLYLYALENTTDRSNRDFQYSLKGRVCKFSAEIGKRERARELAMEAIEKKRKEPLQNNGNVEYEAYQRIRTTLSTMDFLNEIEFPSDALRIARSFDTSLFAKAGRYQSRRKEEFERKQQELLDRVRELGGLEVVRSMISPNSETRSAIDFAVNLGDRPVTQNAVGALWIEMIEKAAEDVAPEKLIDFRKELEQIRVQRPEDDSVKLALAIVHDLAGDRSGLRELIRDWIETEPADSENLNVADRNQLLILGLLRLDRASSDSERSVVDQLVREFRQLASDRFNPFEMSYFLAELSRQALERDQQMFAYECWKQMIDLKASQMLLLDLSLAAINQQQDQISADAFFAAVNAPDRKVGDQKSAVSAGSLGDLLSSARAQRTSSNPNTKMELDPEEVELARRILELDDAWRANKMYTKHVYAPLIALTIGSNQKHYRTLPTPIEIKPTDRIVVESVFERLARRANWTKRTDDLLTHLDRDDNESNLLSAQALLYANRSEEALAKLDSVDTASLNLMPREMVIQVLVLALADPACRVRAMKIGLELVNQNKPSQRYADIEPFDTFSLHLAKTGLTHSMDDTLISQAISNYLQLSAHDNDRYSSINSRVPRRISQLEKVAQLLLPRGRIDQALTYLGMRQSGFIQGFDRGNDWVGSWALESIQSMSDRQAAYQKLADWTFQGDGPLQTIRTLVRRQRLPAWIPESVAGYYPPFAPVPDPQLPVATNYYSLAKLAERSDNTDDLLKRLETAVSEGRAESELALAIVQTALGNSIDEEVSQRIQQQMLAKRPGSGQTKSAAPLAELQLATMLAKDDNGVVLARTIADEMQHHTHRQSRGYLSPWIERFRHENGWAETSQQSSAEHLHHWIGSTMASAKDFSEGKAKPLWVTDGNQQLTHVCGFGNDYLWYRYPLEGNFSIEIETSDGNWSEAELVADSLRFSALGNAGNVYLKTQSTNDWLRYPTKAVKKNEWNRCRVSYDDKYMSYFVNDVLIYREPRRKRPVWIGVHSEGNKTVTVRNMKVTGDPIIPRKIDLIPSGDLRGWSGQYLSVKLPTANVNLDVHEKNAAKPSRYRSAPKPEREDDLAWTVKEKELTSGKIAKQAFQGQNAILYERPLGDGETLQYEFYYEPGETEVHPTIGRIAYLMRPEGMHLHWMAAPNTAWKIPKGFAVAAEKDGPTTIPMQASQWNQVEISRNGRVLTFKVNGETILSKEPQSRLGQMVFGFYHDREKTSARVRNVVLSGPWPQQVPNELLEF